MGEFGQRVDTVGVDFDGVIHRYSNGWHDGSVYDEPNPGALTGLRWLMERYAVFVFTTRHPAQVAPWLREHGFDVVTDLTGEVCDCEDTGLFPHVIEHQCRNFWNEQGRLLVTRRKLGAIAYIDDRAIRFESWHQVLADMVTLRPAYHDEAAAR